MKYGANLNPVNDYSIKQKFNPLAVFKIYQLACTSIWRCVVPIESMRVHGVADMKRTHRLILTLVATLSWLATPNVAADTFGSGVNSFELDFVTIHAPGNIDDTTGWPRQVGGVDYLYRIAKYEVSREMIEKSNAEGGLNIHLSSGSHFLRDVWPDTAATGISWNEAARFVNWLNESQGSPHAYKFTHQPGDAGYWNSPRKVDSESVLRISELLTLY